MTDNTITKHESFDAVGLGMLHHLTGLCPLGNDPADRHSDMLREREQERTR
ncbi:hypothetical protein Lesp02_07030 [Lentzea sp. NBRC 105346]|uniref:hypothetical protein n=1 Tax=Lentzea sp. NBRC 105346 TaxID=3032205 RepID=UPI00249FA5B3|nr:hypothetical protein [Lentzea sp. NBRC 105346]GLZ28513.1 hypothetical protein Lesp02_07030 [Lentzea sp. NBRC 105346]